MEFKEISLDDRERITKYLKKENIGWEYNFATLYLWNANGKMQIASNENMTLVLANFTGKPVFMPPYCNDEHFDEAISLMLDYSKKLGARCLIRGLTKAQADRISDRFNITTNRNEYDYVYEAEKLISLKGKAYHAKRNFVSRFCNNYEYSFSDYTQDDYDSLMDLLKRWDKSTTNSTLEWESVAIARALELKDELKLKIALLKVADKCVAFSVSSIESNGVAHTLFEKADISYEGAYPTINKLTANRYFTADMLVNRQEDMGIEGLRKAKLSYSPLIILEKYNAEEIL